MLKAIAVVLLAVPGVAECGTSKSHRISQAAERSCTLVGVPQEKQCEYVHSHASCADDSLMGYTRMYACGGLSPASAIIALLLWASLLFLVLTSVAEKLFAPALEHIAAVLRLRADIAGCTLLALGNSAPDIASQVAAIDPAVVHGSQLAVAEVVGAGFFAGTVGLAFVALNAPNKPASVLRKPFARDVGFYLAAICMLFTSLAQHRFTYWHAVCFILLYLMYIAFLVLSRAFRANGANGFDPASNEEVTLLSSSAPFEEELRSDLEPPRALLDADAAPESCAKHNMPQGNLSGEAVSQNRSDVHAHEELRRARALKHRNDSSADIVHDHFPEDPIAHRATTVENDAASAETSTRSSQPLYNSCFHEFSSSARRLSHLFTAACEEMLLLTVPDIRPTTRHRYFSSACRPFLFTCLFIFGELEIKLADIGSAGCILAAVALIILGVAWEVYLYANSEIMQLSSMQMAACIAAVFGAIVWMDTTAGELVALIAACGRIFGVSQGFLGETLLAWGNCIPDVAANVSISRSGEPHMAMAACFASPMFNLLVGQTVCGLYRIIAGNIPSVSLRFPRTLSLTVMFHTLSLLHSLIAIPVLYRCDFSFSTSTSSSLPVTQKRVHALKSFIVSPHCVDIWNGRGKIKRNVAIGMLVYFLGSAAIIIGVSASEA